MTPDPEIYQAMLEYVCLRRDAEDVHRQLGRAWLGFSPLLAEAERAYRKLDRLVAERVFDAGYVAPREGA